MVYMRRRVLILLAATGLVAIALTPGRPAGAQPARPLVVLVTIDGMLGDYLGTADAYHLKIPTLRRLMREGSRSERTLSVFPTLTGTAHTSLVTGTWAGKHGILGNNRFDPAVWTWDRDNYDAQPPYRDASAVKARTLWIAAREKGLRTAAVGWPQVENAPIDYRISPAVGATAQDARDRTARYASPGWLDKVEARLGPLGAVDLRMADHLKALVGAELLRLFEPAFMAVHFTLTDSVQHASGPGTAAALAAMEETDQNVAILVQALSTAALAGRATLVVTGDHGFLPMHTELAINLPLVEAGLIRKGAGGTPEWDAIVAPNRGLGSLYLKPGTGAEQRAREALTRYARQFPRRFRLLERAELDRFGADRDAVLGVEPYPGYVLDARLSPPFAAPHARAAGHGYAPDTPGMETGLVLWGRGVRAGTILNETQTIDVAPTIASLLGLELPDADGRPIAGALEPAPAVTRGF
jgi:predicted AlkP superfamily pyrophosphatase or phosphodiesterase